MGLRLWAFEDLGSWVSGLGYFGLLVFRSRPQGFRIGAVWFGVQGFRV